MLQTSYPHAHFEWILVQTSPSLVPQAEWLQQENIRYIPGAGLGSSWRNPVPWDHSAIRNIFAVSRHIWEISCKSMCWPHWRANIAPATVQHTSCSALLHKLTAPLGFSVTAPSQATYEKKCTLPIWGYEYQQYVPETINQFHLFCCLSWNNDCTLQPPPSCHFPRNREHFLGNLVPNTATFFF